MALDKKLLTVGSKIAVTSLKGKTAGIVDADTTLVGISVRDPVGIQTGVALAVPGDILTVVKLPRKVFGINVCRVRTASNIEGEVFWTELRANCKSV